MQPAKRFALPAPAKPAATLAAPVKPAGAAALADTGDAPAADDDLTMAYAMADGLMDIFPGDAAQVSKICRRGVSKAAFVHCASVAGHLVDSPHASPRRGRPCAALTPRLPSPTGRCARGGHQARSRPRRAGQGVSLRRAAASSFRMR